MTPMPWPPDHLLTLDEWDALPEDTSRHYELAEGVLHVTPRALPLHNQVMFRLAGALEAQLPTDMAVTIDNEVLLDSHWPATIRAPDVLIVPKTVAKANPPRFQAEDLLLAVEIMSPGSRTTDRHTKFFEYAEAGIPRYWIIDIEKRVSLSEYRLVDGEYELVAKYGGTASLESPAAVTIDLEALVTGRA